LAIFKASHIPPPSPHHRDIDLSVPPSRAQYRWKAKGTRSTI